MTSLKTPLRYPGSKRKLAKQILDLVRMKNPSPDLLVEPFAGSASVSLKLIENDLVNEVVLSELDPLLASFWETVFFDSAWLIEKIQAIEISLDKWESFKSMNDEGLSKREQALKCIFLNRTSFSGILNDSAGPLGGREQDSKYTIECRFYRDTICKRIEHISSHSDYIRDIREECYSDTLSWLEEKNYDSEQVMLYLDPPFYNEADRLYRFYFNESEHVDLRDKLREVNHPWILSYDHSNYIHNLYEDTGICETINVTYTSNGKKDTRELLFSNQEDLLPEEELSLS